jgi:hypothetical protein
MPDHYQRTNDLLPWNSQNTAAQFNCGFYRLMVYIRVSGAAVDEHMAYRIHWKLVACFNTSNKKRQLTDTTDSQPCIIPLVEGTISSYCLLSKQKYWTNFPSTYHIHFILVIITYPNLFDY